MSFALFSFFLHDMSMGFVRRNHCDLFCSHVKSCACIDSWVWVSFACCHRSALSHFCLRHRSVNDHTLPVKMCGTHLGVIVSVIFIGSVNHLLRCEARTLGWMRERERWILVFCDGLSCWVACPSCILARVSRNGYTKLSLDVLRVLWRIRQCQVKCLPPRIRQSLDMGRIWSPDLLQDPNRATKPCLTKRKVASRLWTGQARKKTDPVRPGWGCQSRILTIQQKSWHLARLP